MKIYDPSLNPLRYDWESILTSYRNYVKKTDTVLEIGASTMGRTASLAKLCKKLMGVELMPERKPKDSSNINYMVGDWQKLSDVIKPNSIDIALSSHVIEHVQDDLKSLNELYTVLKPGGTALINTPNRKRLARSIIEMFTGDRRFPYAEHVREYTENDLIKLISKSRFKKYKIVPVVFGIHAGPIYVYNESVPKQLRTLAQFWEVHLFKE
ncbi:MAG: class I SAM-dependent methyltransferase [bacterium]|nr:class I SAM-dependent methyltransferase [bacterium]